MIKTVYLFIFVALLFTAVPGFAQDNAGAKTAGVKTENAAKENKTEKAANDNPAKEVSAKEAPAKEASVKEAGAKEDSAKAEDKAPEGAPAKDEKAAQEKKEETSKVKFNPKNTRSPFVSKEEISTLEKMAKAEQARLERERKAAEEARIKAEKAEQARREREAYLKANPHLAIVNKIKIQGMMGDEVQINNDFKAVGDQVMGATITKITGTKIYFKYKGKEFSIPIPKGKE